MCGIVCVCRLDGHAAKKIVEKRYRKQASRGKEGYGYLSASGQKINSVRREENEKEILDFLSKDNSSFVLFHHRFPTSTPNLKDAAHPIYVNHPNLKYDYYVVHNGVITNADKLKDDHSKQFGFEYTTLIKTETSTKTSRYLSEVFNDSEAFAIDFALFIEGVNKKIDSLGSIAFIAVQVEKETSKIVNMFYGRNTNPLVVDTTKFGMVISSLGDGPLIESHKLFRYELATGKIFESDVNIGYKFISAYGYTGRRPWEPEYNHNNKTVIEFNSDPSEDIPDSHISNYLPLNEGAEESDIVPVTCEQTLMDLYEKQAQLQDEIETCEAYHLTTEAEKYKAELFKLEQEIVITEGLYELETNKNEPGTQLPATI